MEEEFRIYVEQLREGREKKLQEAFSPDFLEIQEIDLSFEKEVKIDGEAYLADKELVIHWNIETEAKIPCSICNEWVNVPIKIQNAYFSEPIEEIKTGIYSFKSLLRETVLLAVPPFTECQGGKCPLRKEYAKFLKESSSKKENEAEGYHPFADLDWK